MLAGGAKLSEVGQALGFSVLNVELTPGRSLIGEWSGVSALVSSRPLVVLTNHAAMIRPDFKGWNGPADWEGVRVYEDRGEYRGPAGVVRDAVEAVAGDAETVVVVESACWPSRSLGSLVREHLERGASATVGRNPDGSPSGVIAARRSSLVDHVPGRGFMDLKEQWLEKVVSRGGVARVFDEPWPGGLPMRRLEDVVRAGRFIHGLEDGLSGSGVLGERSGRFSCVCDGSEVGAGATVADTIVMHGARVGEGSVVVRCIVGPGGVVGPGDVVVDEVVSRRGVAMSDRGGGL